MATFNVTPYKNGFANNFFADLARHYGVEGHPKLDVLQNIVYDLGHSHGYDEMVNLYDDLVALLK